MPTFVKQSRRRIKELTAKLRAMPPALADDNKRRNAFLVVMSRVTEQLKGLLTNGSNEPVCGEGKTKMNIVPDVTAMYRAYAAGIMQVGLWTTLYLYSSTKTKRSSIIAEVLTVVVLHTGVCLYLYSSSTKTKCSSSSCCCSSTTYRCV